MHINIIPKLPLKISPILSFVLTLNVDFMDMQDNAKDYDIEALTGNESEYIEMVNENFFIQFIFYLDQVQQYNLFFWI